jgi:thiamine kinase-like enzyme
MEVVAAFWTVGNKMNNTIANPGAEHVRQLTLWRGLRSVSPLTGGVSNASFKVIDETGQYVVRFGESYPFHQVDRAREVIASRAACDVGLSPNVVMAGDGVLVLTFIEGRTFGEAEVRTDVVRCVELVATCHREMKRKISGQGAIFWVFQILRDYCHRLAAARHRLAHLVPGWINIVDRLEDVQVPMPIVFGHHDLLPANFIDDGKRLWLIDWEYAAFGTAMFDLANLSANNSFDASLDDVMLDTYFLKTPGSELRRAFAAMKVASALREALWGMVSELHLNAPGVDYVDYAKIYLARFDALHSSYTERFP